MMASFHATCPNIVQGLTSWNFKISFLVDSNEHVLKSDNLTQLEAGLVMRKDRWQCSSSQRETGAIVIHDCDGSCSGTLGLGRDDDGGSDR
ncbi:hypothetical protein L6452_15502 [Arctium lappa]|uniref:Uncharacterized protein n=1 Tax=Arctium lappa TaxID=4217 RepID=A0ACB9CNR7_ARCLA|nr:hypothetical protein L6452_15502 [Arctium lappa]